MAVARHAIRAERTAAGLDPDAAGGRIDLAAAGFAFQPGKEFGQFLSADLEDFAHNCPITFWLKP